MGRAGSEVPADIVLSILIGIVIPMLCSGVYIFIYRLTNKIRIFTMLSLLFFTIICILINGLYFDIYTAQTPKRLYIQSIVRYFANDTSDSGLFINVGDSLLIEPLTNIGIDVFDNISYHQFKIQEMPWYLPIEELYQQSMYIPTDKPLIPHEYQTEINIINQSYISNENAQLIYFSIIGPSHFSINIDTKYVIEWSLDIPIFHGKDDILFIFLANGSPKIEFEILNDEMMYQYISENDNAKKPVKSSKIFWIKIKYIPHKPFSFIWNSHHINGKYARNVDHQLPIIKNNIMPNLPEWTDPILFISEWFEVVVTNEIDIT